jgi:hypothetical protein
MLHRFAAVVAVALIGLVACGGDSSDGPATAGDNGDADVQLAGDAPREIAVTPEAAAGSPLPEVTVRRVNGEGGFVQLKNELPADRPLLFWFWAPT